jgi:hypothetical protein
MAFTTTDVLIRPEDGWVEVASNYATLYIRPAQFQPWFLAVNDGAAPPSNDLVGAQFGRGADNAREVYETAVANTGKAWIRVMQPSASDPGAKSRFAVIKS